MGTIEPARSPVTTTDCDDRVIGRSDRTAKYAPAGKYTLSPVKLTCSGLSCSGEAKACKK